MQVWDSVKVLAGSFEGKAGSVQTVVAAKEEDADGKFLDILKVGVKLDIDGQIHEFNSTELQRLG